MISQKAKRLFTIGEEIWVPNKRVTERDMVQAYYKALEQCEGSEDSPPQFTIGDDSFPCPPPKPPLSDVYIIRYINSTPPSYALVDAGSNNDTLLVKYVLPEHQATDEPQE